MRHTEVSGQPFPAHLLGMLLRQACKLLACCADRTALLWESSAVLGCQIKGVRWRKLTQGLQRSSGAQDFLQTIRMSRSHALGKNLHHSIAQCFIGGGRLHQVLTELLIKRHSMKFSSADTPP